MKVIAPAEPPRERNRSMITCDQCRILEISFSEKKIQAAIINYNTNGDETGILTHHTLASYFPTSKKNLHLCSSSSSSPAQYFSTPSSWCSYFSGILPCSSVNASSSKPSTEVASPGLTSTTSRAVIYSHVLLTLPSPFSILSSLPQAIPTTLLLF